MSPFMWKGNFPLCCIVIWFKHLNFVDLFVVQRDFTSILVNMEKLQSVW